MLQPLGRAYGGPMLPILHSAFRDVIVENGNKPLTLVADCLRQLPDSPIFDLTVSYQIDISDSRISGR